MNSCLSSASNTRNGNHFAANSWATNQNCEFNIESWQEPFSRLSLIWGLGISNFFTFRRNASKFLEGFFSSFFTFRRKASKFFEGFFSSFFTWTTSFSSSFCNSFILPSDWSFSWARSDVRRVKRNYWGLFLPFSSFVIISFNWLFSASKFLDISWICWFNVFFK